MSKENVEVVRKFEEAMVAALDAAATGGEADFDSILAMLDENIVIHGAASLPHGADQVGHAGFFKLGELFSESWTFVEKPTFIYRDAEDVVLLHATFELENRTSGKRVPVEMVELHTVKNGKIVDLMPYYRDTVPEAEAAGLVKVVSPEAAS